MDVSVIIVSYNTFAMTRDAISSVFEAVQKAEVEVIVVDNNSPDNSASLLKQAFDSNEVPITIMENRENTGFATANNQGAAIAKGQHLFFLNPDTIVHKDAIDTLVHFLSINKKAGAIGPRVLNTDGSDQVSIARYATAWTILRHHLPVLSLLSGKNHHHKLTQMPTGPVDVVKGCAIMVKRDVFQEIGKWDDSYFMYSEETELCRALNSAGYTNYFVREAVITHHGGQSSLPYYAEQQIVQQRSALQYLRRHHGRTVRIVHRVSGVIGFGIRALAFPIIAMLRPAQSDGYKLRGKAASGLFRWFLFEYV